jgi:redox-sensitive bicupin YhaK (pirin superfamily)
VKSSRKVLKVIEPLSVTEGAGVRLHRTLGSEALDYLDPFLLLDHFASRDRRDYEAGFPLHPHRGMETVTYVLRGEVQHKDTLGSSGSIRAGDVQWMTAGRGIMHEEMPQVRPEGIAGFQLWVNLPAALKMTPPAIRKYVPHRSLKSGKRAGSRFG